MEMVDVHEKYLSHGAGLSQSTLLRNLVATEGKRIEEELGKAQPSSGGRVGRRGGMLLQNDTGLDKLQKAQADYQRVYESQEGVCAALSHKWIKMKLKEVMRLGKHGVEIPKKEFVKSTPAERMAALQREPTLKRAVQRQANYIDAKNPFAGLDNMAVEYKILDKGELSGYIHGKRQMNTPDSIAAAASLIISHTHHCFLFAISCPKLARGEKLPAHAVACYVSSGDKLKTVFKKEAKKGHVYFFDPNFGEYCVPKLEFTEFLKSFLYSKYGAADKNLRSIDQFYP